MFRKVFRRIRWPFTVRRSSVYSGFSGSCSFREPIKHRLQTLDAKTVYIMTIKPALTLPTPWQTPAELMPWPVQTPFRVAPGLSRLAGPEPDRDTLLWRHDRLPDYRAYKALRLRQGDGQAGEADPRVLDAIATQENQQTGHVIAADPMALSKDLPEDFVILHDEPDVGFVVRYLSVCFASNWSPADKLGLGFAAVHAPVADNRALLAARAGIETIAFRQAPMRRHVWLLSPSPDLWQAPHERAPRWAQTLTNAAQDEQSLLSQVHFRVERQTTLPLPAIKRAVFFIHVMVCPLIEVLRLDACRAGVLANALDSMSPAFVAYRGMTTLRDPLTRALRAFAC